MAHRELNNQTPQPKNGVNSSYNSNQSTADSGSDFMSNLDSYIKYFENDSEDAAMRQAKVKQYYAT